MLRMDFERLDSREFASIGIRFETEEETRAFGELIREELEVRIGKAISSQSTREQLAEFDKCTTRVAAQQWLRKNCPDYRKIVMQKREELENEIIRYKSKVAGVLPEMDTIPAEADISGLKPWDGYLIEEEDDFEEDYPFDDYEDGPNVEACLKH